jgi:hypothetical protein
VLAQAIVAGRATVEGRAIVAGRATVAGQVIVADRAIAADRARAIGVAPVTAEVRASPIAAGPVRVAGTTPSAASAAVRRRSATPTAVTPATSRWRIAVVGAPVQARGRAAAQVRAHARAVAAARAAAEAVAVVAAAVAVVAAAGAKGDSIMRTTLHRIRGAVATHITSLTIAAALLVASAPAALAQQKTFPSPEAAMNAFGDAVATSDEDALKALLGADFRTLIPPTGAESRYRFLAAWAKSHAIKPEGDAMAHIAVGGDGWTMPIPIVKTAQGWRFDTKAGAEEMRLRRIGRNELAVMQVMLAIYDAEKEYARQDHNGDGVLQYASKLVSSPGKRDGLYWPTKAGEAPSPLGPAVAAARAKGGSADTGYYGYRYKLLDAQGKNAQGGAYDYVARGRMIGGFAAVAWPAKYGDTGVMTFIVSHDGVVYEKDLGPNTAALAAAMTRFDPDSSWQKVQPGT